MERLAEVMYWFSEQGVAS